LYSARVKEIWSSVGGIVGPLISGLKPNLLIMRTCLPTTLMTVYMGYLSLGNEKLIKRSWNQSKLKGKYDCPAFPL